MSALTQRELQILEMVAKGLSDKQIAFRCSIRIGTVKAHLRSVLIKLDAVNRTQAVVIAIARGLIEPTTVEPGERLPSDTSTSPRSGSVHTSYISWDVEHD